MTRRSLEHDQPELWRAYRETDYEVATALGEIIIKVDEPTPLLDELLHQHQATEWAFITAHNPGSQKNSPIENDRRQEELLAEVIRKQLVHFLGRGVGADPFWPCEESLLVLGITKVEAIELARRYGQNAIVYGRREEPAQLVDCGSGSECF